MKATSLFAAGCIALLTPSAGLPLRAADTPQSETVASKADAVPVTLGRVYKPDLVQRFKTTIHSTVNGTDVELVEKTHQVVKEIKKNGDVVIESQTDGGSYTFNGTTQPTPDGPPRLSTTDKFGKLTDFKADESGLTIFSAPVEKLLAIANHIILPSSAVKPKEVWKTEFSNPAATGKKVIISSTFLGTDKANGITLWKVLQTIKADVDGQDMPLTEELTVWLNPADGQAVKVESKAANIPAAFGSMSWTSTTERVKEEAKTGK